MPLPEGSILEIGIPDDFHVHFRDGEQMRDVLPDTVRQFARAIVMPNLKPPVTTTGMAEAYRQRILASLPPGSSFTPLMTLYLTEDIHGDEIKKAKESGFIHGIKLYPAGATTHSDAGVRKIENTFKALEAMEKYDLPLLIHAEDPDPGIDIFFREESFLTKQGDLILKSFPGLRVVIEHISTAFACDFMKSARKNTAATITAHHLLLNRNAIFAGGLRPHHYCLPVLKSEEDRIRLVETAVSGDPRFFAGTDSAPHPKRNKETSCCSAGIYTAHAALELYAEVFDRAGFPERLDPFVSSFGARFYGLEKNPGRMKLEKKKHILPAKQTIGDDELIPLRAGESLEWRISN